MLYVGKQITAPGDPLNPVPVKKVFDAIINPEGEVATLQKRLQQIRMIDLQQYRKLKTGLPYLVCAHFHPKIRRKENFVSTERFIMDIDHLSEFDLEIENIKKKLCEDARVEMIFTSPGGDGLKILFCLAEKISDSGYYAMFYKAFCVRFAVQFELGGAVDTKTNDVSRCCFVSHDPDAYLNMAPEKVDASEYMPIEGAIDFDLLKSAIKKQEKEYDIERKEAGIKAATTSPLTDDVLRQIKEKVGVRVKKPVEKYYEQPEELDNIMIQVMEQLEEVGASLAKSSPISYGRQIKIMAGNYWAEVNIFYGQRGVSIIGTSKTGSNRELCDSIVALLKNHFS